MNQEEPKKSQGFDESGQDNKRRQRGEAAQLPLKVALRRGKSGLKSVHGILHHAQETNGLNPGERFHAKGDLEDIKHSLEKIQGVVQRLEKLLE